MERKVCIVGAGISGLLACKYALAKGYYPLVIEFQSSLGGVWTKTFETTKLQTPKFLYQFSDHPWPSSVETLYPNQNQILDYIQSYAKRFDMVKHIRFNTKVLSIKYEGPSDEEMQSWALWGGNGDPFSNKGKWMVNVHDLVTLSSEEIQVDFVILCLGRFSDIPNMPEFPENKGPEIFKGQVIHSIDYASMDNQTARDFVKGKRVAVVGFQKSAVDIAMECSVANGEEHPCTVICRTPHWVIPDLMPWGVPCTILYMNRFAELLVHKPGEGLLLSLLASFLSPLRWVISKFVESDAKKRQKLKKYDMVPKHSFSQEVNSCSIAIMPQGFYDNVEKGSICLRKCKTFNFCKQGLLIDDKVEPIKSDLVILATGFKGDLKLRDIFASPKFQDYIVGSLNTTVPLYRECIHPRIPQVAMIGFSESLSNMYTYELRCRWLAELLDGNFKLPNIDKMEKDALEWDTFMKRYSGNTYKRSCTATTNIWYNDQLCKDMGLNPKRKNGFWAELFEPYGPMDYA